MIFLLVYPGLGFKRWILVIMFGLFCAAEGLAVAQGSELISLLERPVLNLFLGYTGEPLRILSGAFIVLVGILIMGLGFSRLMRNVLTGLVPGAGSHWGEKLLLQYNLKKGPSIVAIGGGTGLSTLLRGLKEVTATLPLLSPSLTMGCSIRGLGSPPGG